MQIAELLVEHRRVGDQFRVIEKIIEKMHGLLARAKVNALARKQLEADLTASTAEWLRIGQRMLELDKALAKRRRH